MNSTHAQPDSLPITSPRLLLAGCGFLGLPTARLFHGLGWEVTALTHSPASAQRLAGEPFRVLACDINHPAELARLGAFDAVIDCVSSNRGGPEDYRRVYLDGARSLLEAVPATRFVFTSSTSVYAQSDGSIVSEESAAEPERETGQILRATEDAVLAGGGRVLRLAGLYGPDRWAFLCNFLEGRAVIEGDGTRWINQIHQADAASALVFTCIRDLPKGIYNVADDTPVMQREAYAAMATHFGLPEPPRGLIDADRKRGWTNKRVSNAKLRAFGWAPRYASFREAL